MHNTTLQCTMEKEEGGGERKREKEWQTATGKINRNVVNSWVLMSTIHSHLRRNTNGQKEKIKREKEVKY